ncbi:hypothetical protein GCM10023093_19250 [Nemorincola caseinilytica]|uniref:Carboxypeptidase regulatory-like domain-containing protein n=1 Tax=Nemorincola caseinilytica TaxID=2054315 RepID=A0ABP8NEP7_9BACT
MKPIIAVIACLLIAGASHAQNTAKPAGKAKIRKNAIGGTITDARHRPIPKVQAFIYYNDSATNSSGYTDASGRFETNNVLPGTYNLRLVYPSAKRLIINGVPVSKLRVTQIDIATSEPTTDSAISYTDIAKPTAKK